MLRINIILMLSTIIPDLDCCSSFTIFNRKSIHLYPTGGLDFTVHKSMQFQQNHHNHHFLHQQQTPPSPPPEILAPQLPPIPGIHGQAHTNSSHKHLQLDSNKNSEQPDEDYLRLNRSLSSDIQDQEERLEKKLVNDKHERGSSTIEATTPTTTMTTTVKTTTTKPQNQLEDDARYNLISEIVSMECVDFLKLEFCLNGGRCFLYPILNHSLSSCECAEGFVGERCEAKSYEFIPRIRPRLVLAKTKGGLLIYGLALLDVLFLLFLFCKNYIRD